MDSANFAYNIKRLIKKHGYSLHTFSTEHLNIKYHKFSRDINSRKISLNTILKLMDLFKCNFYDLVRVEEHKEEYDGGKYDWRKGDEAGNFNENPNFSKLGRREMPVGPIAINKSHEQHGSNEVPGEIEERSEEPKTKPKLNLKNMI